mgnify:CR=1 FL=1
MMDNRDIEELAKAICTNLGLNPFDQIQIPFGENMTPAEVAEYQTRGQTWPLVLNFGMRWESYRGKAAEAIAVHQAMNSAYAVGPTP